MYEDDKRRAKIIVLIIGIIIAIVLAIFLGTHLDEWIDTESSSFSINSDVTINGEKYKKRNITSYVIIGIDNQDKINERSDSNQADFVAYVVFNHAESKYNVLHVNRDSWTSFKRISSVDPFAAPVMEGQIALSHDYGNDASAKNLNTVYALRSLLNNLIPLNNEYLGFTMGAFPSLVNIMGEVKITITEDLVDEGLNLKLGDQLTLNGSNALDFVRYRSEATDKSNLARMKRQRAFINAYLEVAKGKHLTYQALTENAPDYFDSNINIDEFDQILNNFSLYNFDGIVTLDGVVSEDLNGFARYDVSEESINNFLTTYIYERVA